MDNDLLKIRPLETDKDDIELNEAMKAKIIPAHAFSALVCGKSGSGKTMMVLNLLTRKEFYAGYFNEIYLVSPTAGEGDDLYKRHLKIKPDKIFKPDKEGVEKLQKIIEMQKKDIKMKGMGGCKKVLIIFDDVAHKRKFLASDTYLNLHIANRHYCISCMTLVQSYVKMPRSCRCNCSAIFFMHGCTNTEEKRLCDEHCPTKHSEEEFSQIVSHATALPYDFLYINKQKKMKYRYMKNLDKVLILDKLPE